MAYAQKSTPAAQRYPTGKIWLAGLLTIAIAVAVNYLIFWIATGLLGMQSTFAPFVAPMTFGIFTTLFLVIAILVWWLIARRATMPEQTFKRVALIALIVSIIPNILMLFVPLPAESGAITLAAALVLIVMHIASWYVAITVLPRSSRA
jgi:hypothetical protein